MGRAGRRGASVAKYADDPVFHSFRVALGMPEARWDRTTPEASFGREKVKPLQGKMRQNSNQRRGRSRSNQNRRPGRNQSFDSNGPSVRLRGTAVQLNEKYQALARDATSAGDRVMAENYHQHADHYYRVMISQNPPQTREEDRQPDLAASDESQPHDGRGRGERGQLQGVQNQGSQNPDRQNQDRQNQDRRNDRNRRSKDRQEDSEEQTAASDEAGAADRPTGAEAERRTRDRRQTARRQDSDPRRRGGGRADEEVPGDEPLDRGLHRILGGGAEKQRPDGDSGDPAGDTATAAGSAGNGPASEAPAADSPPDSAPDSTGDKTVGEAAAPAADTGKPAEKAPKPRTRRRKPAAEAEDTASAEPVADVAV